MIEHYDEESLANSQSPRDLRVGLNAGGLSFEDRNGAPNAAPRESIDVRALVFSPETAQATTQAVLTA